MSVHAYLLFVSCVPISGTWNYFSSHACVLCHVYCAMCCFYLLYTHCVAHSAEKAAQLPRSERVEYAEKVSQSSQCST